LLHAVHPISEEDLQRGLRSLTDSELLYVRAFRHKGYTGLGWRLDLFRNRRRGYNLDWWES